MSQQLTSPTTRPHAGLGPAVDLDAIRDQARAFAAVSRAENTARAYRADWRTFANWCAAHSIDALPASGDALALFVADRASTCKPATLRRQVVAITRAHAAAGYQSPAESEAVRAVMCGVARAKGTAPRQKRPMLPATLRQIVEGLPDDPRGRRDAAVMLLGFAGAFRRSELVALDVEDLEFVADGVVVTLRRSKTDQAGAGRRVGIPRLTTSDACPVAAVEAWLSASGIITGPLFRGIDPTGTLAAGGLSDRSIALIVKRHLPAGVTEGDFAGHSLRAGFVTAAAAGGASVKSIARTTGHKSVEVLLRYEREASLFKRNALASTGL